MQFQLTKNIDEFIISYLSNLFFGIKTFYSTRLLVITSFMYMKESIYISTKIWRSCSIMNYLFNVTTWLVARYIVIVSLNN